MERDEDDFDLDEEFPSGDDDAREADRFLDRKAKPGTKKGKAAWSKLEDMLAERRLERQLKDEYDDGE